MNLNVTRVCKSVYERASGALSALLVAALPMQLAMLSFVPATIGIPGGSPVDAAASLVSRPCGWPAGMYGGNRRRGSPDAAISSSSQAEEVAATPEHRAAT